MTNLGANAPPNYSKVKVQKVRYKYLGLTITKISIGSWLPKAQDYHLWPINVSLQSTATGQSFYHLWFERKEHYHFVIILKGRAYILIAALHFLITKRPVDIKAASKTNSSRVALVTINGCRFLIDVHGVFHLTKTCRTRTYCWSKLTVIVSISIFM
jgi:hypothetical protein